MYYLSKLLKRLKPVSIKNSVIHRTSKIENGTNFVNSKIGRYSFCGYDCNIINVDIGNFCSLAGKLSVGLSNHPIEWASTSPAFYFGRDSIKKTLASKEYNWNPERTIIGNDVWIGENTFIKAGVKIGNGVVIGMGSVVTKDIPSYQVWAGNPARFIRNRFDDSTIRLMEESEWWNLSDEKLREIGKLIDRPVEFCLNSIELGDD